MPKIGSIGIPELLIILVVVLLIFGPRRLPDMAKGLGQSVREFRKGLRDMRKEFNDDEGDETPNVGANPPASPAGSVSAAAAAASTAPVEAQSAVTDSTPSGASAPEPTSDKPASETAADDDSALKS